MRQPLIHEILADLISDIDFKVSFKSITDNGNGTFTLNSVTGFHHIQPGTTIAIDGHNYVVLSYNYQTKIIILKGTDAISVTEFDLPTPYFCHGTPIAQENELAKIDLNEKTPMIYLMEPYQQEDDDSNSSSIAYRATVMICFLTDFSEADSGLTDDIYYNAIYPMRNLERDLMDALKESNKFYNVKQKSNPTFYTHFGINIKMAGVKELLFSQNLAGVGLEVKLEAYAINGCDDLNLLANDGGEFIEVD